MGYTVTLIPGDGIGPEVSRAMQRVLAATGVAIDWDVQEAGEAMIARRGTPLPEEVLASIRRNKVGIKGPITTPVGGGFRSVNVTLRKALDLYANLRPTLCIPGVPTRYEGVDLVVAREHRMPLCGHRARGHPWRGGGGYPHHHPPRHGAHRPLCL
jgi:isocitrate dehydrogenase (NAD+)